MKIYFIIRENSNVQETFCKDSQTWEPRDESKGFERRYCSRSAAIRRAKLVGGNVVSRKQWRDIGNGEFDQPGQSFAEKFCEFVREGKAVQS